MSSCRRFAQAEARAAVTRHDVTPIYGHCKSGNEQNQNAARQPSEFIKTYTKNHELQGDLRTPRKPFAKFHLLKFVGEIRHPFSYT
jgi:hypothetical protein